MDKNKKWNTKENEKSLYYQIAIQ